MKRFTCLIGLVCVYALVLGAFHRADARGDIQKTLNHLNLEKQKAISQSNGLSSLPPPPFPPVPK